MGLELSKELSNGVTALYWNIGAADVDFANNHQHVHLDGYLTKASRNSGKDRVERIMEILNLDLDKGSELHTQLYTAVKALDSWSKAKDILEK
jgi:hypothetical protein